MDHPTTPSVPFSLAEADTRNFSWTRFGVIIFLLLPMVISVVYMWAMWDPTKNLRNVPLALVNNDIGITRDGTLERHGDKVAEALLSKPYLDFHEVSAAEATRGLADGTYLFTVTLTEDFSTNLLSVMTDTPTAPEIQIAYNDFNGTNGSVLTGGLVPKLQAAINASISETYATKLIGGINDLGAGLDRAATGSAKLAEGAVKLNDGLIKGNDGAQQLAAGASKLADGTEQLATGADKLVAGTAKLGDGAQQIDAGVGKLTDTLIPLLRKAQDTTPQLKQAASALHSAGLHAEAAKLAELVDKLDAENPNNQVAQLQKLKNGTATLAYMLADPTSEYHGGVVKLRDGLHKADEGADKLAAGSAKLAEGTVKLQAGSQKISDGIAELSGKLETGATNAPKAADVDASAHQVALPVAFQEQNSNPVQTVIDAQDPTVKQLSGGASMLIIMVFGYLLMAMSAILIPHVFGTDRRTAFIGPTLKSFVGLSLIGMVALAILAAVSYRAGWQPASISAVAWVFALIATSAAACNQLLRALFGRFTGGIAILSLFAFGMFSFGGVWPLATVPRPFQLLHPFGPMTYGRQAFISATAGDMTSQYFAALSFLAMLTVLPLTLTLLVRARRVARLRG